MSALMRGSRRVLGALLLLPAVLLAAPIPAARALDAEERFDVAQAFRAADQGEWARVWRLLATVDDPLPAKALRWLHMIEDGQPDDFPTMARFLMANPDWPEPERLQVRAEGAIRDPADHALIRAFFAERPPLTTRGRIRYAEALLEIGDEDQAMPLIRKAWIDGDFSAREDQRFYARYRPYLREQDNIARLDSLLWDQRRSSATRMLKRVPESYRKLAEARIQLQQRSGGVDRAIKAVPASLRDDPGLAFDRLHWRREKRLYDGVAEILLNPPRELGRPDRWWFERDLEIKRSLRRRDFNRAYRLAAGHGQTEGDDLTEAAWLAGWLALRHAKRPSDAFRHFSEMYEAVSAPTERARAAYWVGRSAAALGDRALARSWYQAAARNRVAWYGQLAAAEIGEPVPATALPPPDPAARAAFEANEITRVARMLIEIGADDQLRPFAMHLIGEAASPTEVAMGADLIAESGRADLVTQASRVAAYRGQVYEAGAFPIPDLHSLLDGTGNLPDTALLLGVARQESTFSTSVMSHAGARGMLQLMPGTAHLMARALNIPFNSARLTADPAYNIRLGRHYLRLMLERYDGEAALAVAAYNAGPRRVEEWIELNGDPRRGTPYDLVDWVELIPFNETRDYVQRVLEARTMYRERLAEEGVVKIRLLEVAGPIRPAPRPSLKPLARLRPLARAHDARSATIVAGAPSPELKPILETGLTPVAPSAVTPATLLEELPVPAEAPKAGRRTGSTRLAQSGVSAYPKRTGRSGQTESAGARMPEARPVRAGFDAGESDPSLPVWPELKPDRLAALEPEAGPPQPELKPQHP